MKKVIAIAALFTFAGIASAQNAAAPAGETPAAKPEATTTTASPADAPAKTVKHKKVHAKKKAKAAKNDVQAKGESAAPAAKSDVAAAPTK